MLAARNGYEPVCLVVQMDLPEMGLTGEAVVTNIQPAPAVRSGNGRVVTVTFKHSSGDCIDLVVADSDTKETFGTTSNHPFWCVDRQDYVQAGSLVIGEQVQTFSGDTKRVVSKLPRPGTEAVYNLEVHAEHVYYVGQWGVLVHNTRSYDSDVLQGEVSHLPDSYMNQKHYVDMEPARGLPGSTLNARGEVRNANYFWRELLERYPDMFSKGNRYRITSLGLSPKVDSKWIKHNPTHQSFKKDVLHHHHVDHGPIAVPLPKTVHEKCRVHYIAINQNDAYRIHKATIRSNATIRGT